MECLPTTVKTVDINLPDGPVKRTFHYSNIAPQCYPESYSSSIHVRVVYVSKNPDELDVLEKQIRDHGDEEQRRKLVNERDVFGMTPLHTAVYFRSIESCKVLLSFGADINATNEWGYTPLFLALGAAQDTEMGKELLAKGADPNIAALLDSGEHWTIFHLAALMHRLDMLRLLAKHGANPSQALFDGIVPLHLAVNDEIRLCIMALSRQYNRKKENNIAICKWCGKRKGLRRCKDCYVTFYCDEKCQRDHWNYKHAKDCPGSIVVGIRFKEFLEGEKDKAFKEAHDLTMDSVYDKEDHHMWVTSRRQLELQNGKYFVSKVEYEPEHTYVVCSNEDFSIHCRLFAFEPGFSPLAKILAEAKDLRQEDYIFLWATPVSPEHNIMKVFPGKNAPWQKW